MQRENLQILASFLAYDPRGVDFDMATFTAYTAGEDSFTDCGSAGCAVGHASLIFSKSRSESWDEFSNRLFGVTPFDSQAGSWCFDSGWTEADNTRLGAAKRIQFLLDNRLPERYVHAFDCFASFTDYYQNTEVRKDLVSEGENVSPSSVLIAELMDKISREPRFQPEKVGENV